jgi:hypothetical protein
VVARIARDQAMEGIMSKSIVLGLAVLALVSTIISGAPRHKAGEQEDQLNSESDTLTAEVLVDSIRVIAYVDSTGVLRPPDSTLVPPVPISGITRFQIVVRQGGAATPMAAGNR